MTATPAKKRNYSGIVYAASGPMQLSPLNPPAPGIVITVFHPRRFRPARPAAKGQAQ